MASGVDIQSAAGVHSHIAPGAGVEIGVNHRKVCEPDMATPTGVDRQVPGGTAQGHVAAAGKVKRGIACFDVTSQMTAPRQVYAQGLGWLEAGDGSVTAAAESQAGQLWHRDLRLQVGLPEAMSAAGPEAHLEGLALPDHPEVLQQVVIDSDDHTVAFGLADVNLVEIRDGFLPDHHVS